MCTDLLNTQLLWARHGFLFSGVFFSFSPKRLAAAFYEHTQFHIEIESQLKLVSDVNSTIIVIYGIFSSVNWFNPIVYAWICHFYV